MYGNGISNSYRSRYQSTDLVGGSRNSYLSDLEKHLSDYRAGKGNIYSRVPQEISRQTDAASTSLNLNNPKTSSKFAGYLTALTYTERARFVNGVESATEAVGAITNSLRQVA